MENPKLHEKRYIFNPGNSGPLSNPLTTPKTRNFEATDQTPSQKTYPQDSYITQPQLDPDPSSLQQEIPKYNYIKINRVKYQDFDPENHAESQEDLSPNQDESSESHQELESLRRTKSSFYSEANVDGYRPDTEKQTIEENYNEDQEHSNSEE